MRQHLIKISTLLIFLSFGIVTKGSTTFRLYVDNDPYSQDSLELIIIADYSNRCTNSTIELTAQLVHKVTRQNISDNSLIYFWSTAESTKSITIKKPKNYRVSAFYADSYEAKYSSQIDIPAQDLMEILIKGDTLFCGDKVAKVSVIGRTDDPYDSPENYLKVEWPEGIIPKPIYTKELYGNAEGYMTEGRVVKGGVYNIKVTNPKNQCVTYKNFTVKHLDPKFEIVSDLEKMCKGAKCMLSVKWLSDPIEADYSWTMRSEVIGTNKEIEVNKPGYYSLRITEKNTGCEFYERIEIDDIGYNVNILSAKCKSNYFTLQAYSNTHIRSDRFMWFEYDEEKNWRSIGSSKPSLDISKIGKYKVIATTDEGCQLSSVVEVENLDSNVEVYNYFKSQGFYELNISNIKTNKAKRNESNLCNEMTTLKNPCIDDSNIESFQINNEEIVNLEALIESNLKYFHEEYGRETSDFRAYITSSENICACSDYIQQLKTKFEDKDFAFWFHFHKNSDGEGQLFVLSNNKKSDGTIVNFPGNGKQMYTRKHMIDKTIQGMIFDSTNDENFNSKADKTIFTIMNLLLDVHPF